MGKLFWINVESNVEKKFSEELISNNLVECSTQLFSGIPESKMWAKNRLILSKLLKSRIFKVAEFWDTGKILTFGASCLKFKIEEFLFCAFIFTEIQICEKMNFGSWGTIRS